MDYELSAYKLPEGWSFAIINEIISGDGLFKDGDWIETRDQNPRGDVRLIQLADIGDGFFKSKSNRFMAIEKAYELNCTFLKFGDILLARMPEPLGRSCIFPINDNQKYVTVVDIAIIRCGYNGVYNKYLSYILNSLSIRKQIKEFQTGTTRKRISRSNLGKILIPIAPFNEQLRIVAKIEELFSELDHAEQGLRKAQALLETYKQSLLKSAFEGNLTEKWREENNPEPSDKLLEQIREERQKLYGQELTDWKKAENVWDKEGRKDNKPKKPRIINILSKLENLEMLTELPFNWIWIKIGEFEKLIGSGSTPKGGRSVYLNNGIPLLRSMNIYPNKLVLGGLAFIDKYTHEKMERSQLQETDVLLTITGASIGRCAYVPLGFKEGNVNQHVCIIRTFTQQIKYKYLCGYLNSPNAQKIIKMINSGATREALTFEQIRNFPFPLATGEEQIQIINELELRTSVIDKLEFTINENLEKTKTFRQSILKKAFAGEIVAQDLTDEPASELLKRIKAEKKKYLVEQNEQNKSIPKKIRKMSKELSIEEVLKTSDKPMLAIDVWQQSKHKDNIEEFYAELKKIQQNIKEVKKGTESLISLTK